MTKGSVTTSDGLAQKTEFLLNQRITGVEVDWETCFPCTRITVFNKETNIQGKSQGDPSMDMGFSRVSHHKI